MTYERLRRLRKFLMAGESFLTSLPTQRRIWSANSLAGYMRCPRYYFETTVEGRVSQGEASVDLEFGSLMGEAADVFNKALASGVTPEAATDFAVEWALVISGGADEGGPFWGGEYREVWHCDGKVKGAKGRTVKCPNSKGWLPAETLTENGLGNLGCRLCGEECTAQTVYFPYDKTKNRHTLVRAVVEYCDAMTTSIIRPHRMPDGSIGSEWSFLHPLPLENPDGTTYMLSGAYDQVAEIGDSEIGIPEMKTTRKQVDDRYYGQFNPGVQLYSYAWAANLDLPGERPKIYKIIIELGVGYSRVHLHPIRLPIGMLSEWEREMQDWILRAEHDARTYARLVAEGVTHREAGELAYPRNVTACHSMPGAQNTPCPFRDFCKLAPADRVGFMDHAFSKSTHDPLSAKGTR